MNLVTDGPPAVALSVEPAEQDVMRRPPRPPQESMFSHGLGAHTVWVGLLIALLSLATGYWYWQNGDLHWQTMLFTTIILSQMAHVMAIRSEQRSLFQVGILSNKALLGAVLLTIVLQLALIYVPYLQHVFKTVALPARDLFAAVGISSIVFCAVEIEKWFRRRSVEARGR